MRRQAWIRCSVVDPNHPAGQVIPAYQYTVCMHAGLGLAAPTWRRYDVQWPQSTKFSLLRTPFFSNKWCREENKWCREENKFAEKRTNCAEKRKCNLGPPYKWCREENKWCREEKVYFGATVMMAPHTGGTGSGNLVNYECPVIKDGWPTASCPSSLRPGNTWKN